MGKFFNGRVQKDRSSIIRYTIIGVGIFFIIVLFALIANKGNKKPVLNLKDVVTVEVGSEEPDKMEYFTEFKNFDKKKISVDYSRADLKTVGEYYVKITAQGLGDEDVKLVVNDTKAPNLVTRDYSVALGVGYNINNFVESCTDNSGEECIIEYNIGDVDQNGNEIKYQNYTAQGSYTIKLYAKDKSGNTTDVKEVTLNIGTGTSTDPVTCPYGTIDYTASRLTYPVAVIVGNTTTKCALNRDLWDDATTQNPVSEFYKKDYLKLQTDIDAIKNEKYPNGAKIVAYPHFISVLNDDLKGLVGYAIHVKVYMVALDYTGTIDSDDNLILDYYLNSNGSRVYDVNKFNLK